MTLSRRYCRKFDEYGRNTDKTLNQIIISINIVDNVKIWVTVFKEKTLREKRSSTKNIGGTKETPTLKYINF